MKNKLYKNSLKYHKFPIPGKISIKLTKKMNNYKDLSLAYSPGVAFICNAIIKNKKNVFKYTSKGNLIGIISNGTAVLGLGNIGALASKPVMEGKSILFKKFSNIDAFDIEINENNPNKLCNIIKSLEPTFSAINLEDIKSPECFYIEKRLRSCMKIPVFHDDQHGTAITVGAAILNSLKIVKKNIKNIKLVVSGAGAAALSCLDLIIDLGLKKKNIFVIDLNGLIYKNRRDLKNNEKKKYACKKKIKKFSNIIKNADIFLGLSVGNILKSSLIKKMSFNPIILALANPNPEILPEKVKFLINKSIVATGRSDYPNQVNNALCFPYIFKGVLDSGAININREIEIATVYAIAKIAQIKKINNISLFNKNNIIPNMFDNNLILKIVPAVINAANFSNVSKKNIKNINKYKKNLKKFVYFKRKFL